MKNHRCSSCGSELAPRSAFCGNCGQKVGPQTATAPREVSPAGEPPSEISADAALRVSAGVSPATNSAFRKRNRLAGIPLLSIAAWILMLGSIGTGMVILGIEVPNDTAALDKIRIVQTREKVAEKRWNWTLRLDGPDEALNQIESVTYHLYKDFPRPDVTVTNRQLGFLLKASGWGVFTVKVDLNLVSGEVVRRTHRIRF